MSGSYSFSSYFTFGFPSQKKALLTAVAAALRSTTTSDAAYCWQTRQVYEW
jgi:hypothetical protein